MRVITFLLTLLFAGAANAGAWMREPGTSFISFGPVYEETGRIVGSLYAEYGVRSNLTLGVKFDADMTVQQASGGRGFAFIRKPISLAKPPFKLAYEFGIGRTFGHRNDTLVLAGLSLGRGLNILSRDGWLAVDGAFEWSLGDASNTAKLDTTIGLTLTDQFKVMMQVFHSETKEANATTLAPSFIWQPRPDKASYQIGVETQDGLMGFKFAVWRSF